MTKREKEVIARVVKKYNLTTSPPDISNPEVMKKINAEVIEKCIKDIEVDERARAASKAHAHEIGPCPHC